MHDAVKEFAKICSEYFSLPEPIYEFGSLQVSGQTGYSDLRTIFKGEYIGADISAGAGVDVILDLHKIALADNSAGTVLIFNTLEHVERPWIAIKEVRRILRENGVLIISVPFLAKIHNFPGDYWRMTPTGVEVLLDDFPCKYVSFAGSDVKPHTVVAIAGKDLLLSEKFHSDIKAWQGRWQHGDHAKRSFLKKTYRKLLRWLRRF